MSVTHDMRTACAVGDRVARRYEGAIRQVGPAAAALPSARGPVGEHVPAVTLSARRGQGLGALAAHLVPGRTIALGGRPSCRPTKIK